MTSVKEWDSAAEGFQRTYKLGLNDYNAELLGFLEKSGMIFPGCRAADIGCGVGLYARQLAERGCRVTLMDISPEMLRYAEENMRGVGAPYETMLCDFTKDEVSGSFDFSLAAMSPAVCDAATVRKMSEMTHGFCFLTRFYSWEQPDRDKVLRICGVLPDRASEKHRALCEELKSIIEAEGYSPRVKLVDYNWRDELSVKEAAEKTALRSDPELPFEEILRAAESLSHDGCFTDRVYTKAAWIYWRTK